MGFFSRARPIPFVPQMEATECGAACLTMVLAYFGKHVPLAQVRTACKVSRDGLSALDVAEAAEGYGLDVNAVRIEVDELMQMEGPAILHWRLDHFVVFERALGDRVRIVDPGSSRLDIPIAQLAEDFSGIAIFLSKGPKLTPSPKENPSLSYYAKALRTALGPVSLVLGTVLMLELVAFVFPAASQIVLDTVIAPKQDQWLVYVGGVLLFATLLRLALSTVRDHLVTGMQIVVDVTLMGRFMTHLLSLPIEFFEQRTSGDLMSRVQGNAAVRTAAVRAVFGIIDGLLVVSYGALMLAYDPKLGALALAVALLQVAAVFRVRARARELTAGELVATTHEATTFMEAMSSPEATKAFRMERLHISRFTHRSAARLNASLTRRSYIEGRGQLVPVLTALGHAVVLWFGGDAVIHDRMTLGVFASFLAIEALLSQPMNELVSTFQDLQLVREHLARLDDVWSTRKEARGTIDPGRIRGEIRLENVAFRYNRSGPFVVEGIDVAIRPGEKVAIVGPSGAGKSTIAKLLVGLLVPEHGTVWVDGRDLRTLDLGKFRRRTGIVLQDAYVFDDDVRANLAFGDEHATIDTLRQAADTACILPTLDALPQGFDTRLGANAGRLSGGQRQRLVLARELAKEPHLLLLDEATSSLDLDVERTLHQNLASIRCTRIVIAHRLATVRDADRVLVVDGGRVVQDGTYDSLAREPGIFQRMVATLRA